MNQAQNAPAPGVDIGKQVANNIASVRTTPDGVTDVSSAQAALPKLKEATAQIDKTDKGYCRRGQSADAGLQSSL
jgi:hypothetical protein